MKKAIFVAIAFVLVASGVYATQNSTVEAPKSANVYTYYLEGDCDHGIQCSPDFDGNVCSVDFGSSIVYDAPGCLSQNQTNNILGKRQP